jgi:hypothetical protein
VSIPVIRHRGILELSYSSQDVPACHDLHAHTDAKSSRPRWCSHMSSGTAELDASSRGRFSEPPEPQCSSCCSGVSCAGPHSSTPSTSTDPGPADRALRAVARHLPPARQCARRGGHLASLGARSGRDLTRPDSGPQTFETTHRQLALANLADLDPPRIVYLMLFSHPTPPERIAAARAFASTRQRELTPATARS